MYKVIDEEHLHSVCKLNEEGSCRYIGTGTEGYICFKTSIGKSMIDDRVEKGESPSTGDNCGGFNIENTFYVVRTDKGYVKSYTIDERFFHTNCIVVKEFGFTDKVCDARRWQYADWNSLDKTSARALMTSVGTTLHLVKFMELVAVECDDGEFNLHSVIVVNTPKTVEE